VTRGVDDLLADLAEAADAAAELVTLGKKRWDTECPLRLAGEAVIGGLGDIATKLPDEVIKGHQLAPSCHEVTRAGSPRGGPQCLTTTRSEFGL
jgi:hypothetical protein